MDLVPHTWAQAPAPPALQESCSRLTGRGCLHFPSSTTQRAAGGREGPRAGPDPQGASMRHSGREELLGNSQAPSPGLWGGWERLQPLLRLRQKRGVPGAGRGAAQLRGLPIPLLPQVPLGLQPESPESPCAGLRLVSAARPSLECPPWGRPSGGKQAC